MSGGFVEYPSLTQVAQQCVANISDICKVGHTKSWC